MTRRPAVPVLPVLLAVILLTMVIGISGSSAQTDDSDSRLARPGVDPVSQLEADLAAAQSTINTLGQQLATVRQNALESEIRIDIQRATILAMQQRAFLSTSTATAATDTGYDQWKLGYELGGGNHLSSFENVILPCESGGEPNPDLAIGPTDDWGRAQINRPTWSARFEELTGLTFEEHILDPVLNGYMSAVVEQEHGRGLDAWTCWRRR